MEWCRSKKITNSMKTMMWLSGLRGAIAYALAVNMPTGNRAIETTTLFVVVSTTLVLGGTTGPLLAALNLTTKSESSGPPSVALDAPLMGVGRSLSEIMDRHEGWGPPSGFHRWFKWVDHHYLKPVFGGQTDKALEFAGGGEEEDYLSEVGSPSVRGAGDMDVLSDDEEFARVPEVTMFQLSGPGGEGEERE